MGTRGLTGLRRLVTGSVARSVLTHAHCSVLVRASHSLNAGGGPQPGGTAGRPPPGLPVSVVP